MNEKEIDLTDSEANELRALRADQAPPDGLQRRIARELRQHELLRPRWFQSRSSMVAAATTAAVLLVAIGAAAGIWLQSRQSPSIAAAPKPSFMLLLRSDSGSLVGTETDRVRDYGRWAGELVRRGQFVDAGRLDHTSRRLGRSNTAADASPVSGYFIIRAADLDQAVEIARNCPHITYGGELEVRPIDLRRN